MGKHRISPYIKRRLYRFKKLLEEMHTYDRMCFYKTFEEFLDALLDELRNDLQGATTDENINGILWYVSIYNSPELRKKFIRCI